MPTLQVMLCTSDLKLAAMDTCKHKQLDAECHLESEQEKTVGGCDEVWFAAKKTLQTYRSVMLAISLDLTMILMLRVTTCKV